MPKNTRGGKKGRGKKNTPKESKELITKIDGQSEYGKVTSVNGNGRFTILNIDGISRTGIVRGTMRKKVWINNGDLVLTELWDFQNNKCSIIHKYTPEDTDKIVKSNALPSNFLNSDLIDSEKSMYNPFDIDSSDSDDEKSDDKKLSDENESITNDYEVDINDI